MRDEVYKKFSAKVKEIVKECMVTEEVAKTDYNKYHSHTMNFPLNKGKKFYYDSSKLSKHRNTIENLFGMIPQRDTQTSNIRKFVPLTDLCANSSISEQDKAKKAQFLRAQSNVIECFFAFAYDLDFGTISPHTKIPIFELDKKIKTNYQETPDDSEPKR